MLIMMIFYLRIVCVSEEKDTIAGRESCVVWNRMKRFFAELLFLTVLLPCSRPESVSVRIGRE